MAAALRVLTSTETLCIAEAMKVAQHTDDLLIIDNTPWVMAVVLLGFLMLPLWAGVGTIIRSEMIGLGLGMIVGSGLFMLPFFWAFVRRTQMVLDRQAGTVAIRRRTIFGGTQEVYDLAALDRAEVESSYRDGTYTYRMVLRFEETTRPFLKEYAGEKRAETAAELVNGWLGVNAAS